MEIPDKRSTEFFIPYIKIEVSLHSCLVNIPSHEIETKVKEFLTKHLQPDYDSDIEILVSERTL